MKINRKIIFDYEYQHLKNEDLEGIKENINKSLIKIDKKIIIIIDDLDRISDKKLKSIFKIVDLCKDFYNTNFILCYNPNNFNNIEADLKITKNTNVSSNNINDITTQEIDNANLIEYIAKIVNVEYQLLPNFDKLKQFFYETFTNSNIRFSENSKTWIKTELNIYIE